VRWYQHVVGVQPANETANSCALTATGNDSLDANNPLLGALESLPGSNDGDRRRRAVGWRAAQLAGWRSAR